MASLDLVPYLSARLPRLGRLLRYAPKMDATYISDFADALSALKPTAQELEAAFGEWQSSQPEFPTPAEIRSLVRSRRPVQRSAPPADINEPPATKEEREELRRRWRDVQARMDNLLPPMPPSETSIPGGNEKQ